MQIPMIQPQSLWKPPELNQLPEFGSRAKRVGIDLETKDPHLKELGPGVRREDSYPVGVSVAIEDGPAFYLPIRHETGKNLDPPNVLGWLRREFKHFKGEIVGANLPYDLDYMLEEGVEFPEVSFFRDVQVAEPLIDELQMSYSLDNIAKRHGFAGKDERLLTQAAQYFRINKKAEMWRMDPKYVGPYAEEDARLPLKLLRRQERIIDDEDLWNVYNLESRVLPVLLKMRRRGVRVDQDQLSKIEEWAQAEEAKELAKVKHITGCVVPVGEVWKSEVMAAPLKQIGLKLKTNKDGSPSVTKEVLEKNDHEVCKALDRARKVNKLRTTFAASVRRFMIKGRIHCTFNQLRMEKDNGDLAGAAFGRLSCVQPNMQQQPSRGEFAKRWRSIYLPEEGAEWASCDYSQQEPRMLTHFAELCALPGADAAGDRYRNDPNADNHQMMADMAGIPRKDAKTIYLGLCYGMGGAKLCHNLGLPSLWVVKDPDERWTTHPTDSPEGRDALNRGGTRMELAGKEGQELLTTFDSKVPFVKKLANQCEKVAKRRGYIMTLSGRRCRFPKSARGGYDWTYKALNRLIQGSSGDQTKTALVEADKAGVYLQLQVHDEIAASVWERKQADLAAHIMETCVKLRVPSKVDVEIGPSWGASMG